MFRQIETRHADAAVGHAVVHVEAVWLADVVATVDAGESVPGATISVAVG